MATLDQTIIGKDTTPTGVLEYGARDPVTGQRYERFTPTDANAAAKTAAGQTPPATTTPTAPASTPLPTRYPDVTAPASDPIADYYKGLVKDAPTAQDETAIHTKNLSQMQAELDSINSIYNEQISKAKLEGEGRLGSTRASEARSGLLGSDFGAAQDEKTRGYNSDVEKAINAERQSRISAVMTGIAQRDQAEIQARKQEALGNAKAYTEYLQKNQDSARTDVINLAKSGFDLNNMPKDQYQKLINQTGYDPLTFESVFRANKPVPEYTQPMQLKDGTLIVTDKQGNIKNLGKYNLPSNAKFMFAPDGTPFIWDPETQKAEVARGFHEGQFAKDVVLGKNSRLVNPDGTPVAGGGAGGGGGKGGGGGGGGGGTSLTSKQVAKVKAIIAANPGEYGHAAEQINREFGEGTATKADNLLKSAYIIPDNAGKVANAWSSLPDSDKNYKNWYDARNAFANAHPYNRAAALKSYDAAVKRPAAGSASVPVIKKK